MPVIQQIDEEMGRVTLVVGVAARVKAVDPAVEMEPVVAVAGAVVVVDGQ